MRINRTSLIILVLGLLLVVGPLAVRVMVLGYNRRAAPPVPPAVAVTLPEMASTPVPVAAGNLSVTSTGIKMGAGQRKILVDMAHFTGVTTGQLQPLAAALAQRGAILDYWNGDFDAEDLVPDFAIDGINLSLPDQSEQLAERLVGASAMIVVTSFTTWSDGELAVLGDFVADGGNLLIISDPDISGVSVDTTNRLAQPFGVIFEDGYLYDRTHNDEHFTHVPMVGFQNQAAELAGKSIFLYGSRSVSGQVNSQMVSADSTLNSLRAGVAGFTTLALAAPRGEGYVQNVMALGDLDVLTEPFVGRYDNQALLTLVANFLAGSLRTQTLTDFPAYLGSRVVLLAGVDIPRDAAFLSQSAGLQRFLETNGHTLTLQGGQSVAAVLGKDGSPVLPAVDYVYMADFDSAAAETDLFQTGGMALRHETLEPEAGKVEAGEAISVTGSMTGSMTGSVTSTVIIATATPIALPITRTLITLEDGIELIGEESVLILRRPVNQFSTVVAVLGGNEAAVAEGVTRLTTGSYANCVTSPDMAICPFTGKGINGGSSAASAAGATPTPSPRREPGSSTGTGTDGAFRILVIDDNDQAGTASGSPIEADAYSTFFNNLGMDVSQWRTGTNGSPAEADLADYDWVIWSSGEADRGGPTEDEMTTVTDYLFGGGGVFTVSGRDVGDFGQGGEAQALVDILSTGINPILADGLPTDAIQLTTTDAEAYLISENFTPDYYDSILVRGPQSASAGEPVMLSQEMDYDGDGKTDGFMVVAMSLTWLPDAVRNELMANMAIWASGLE